MAGKRTKKVSVAAAPQPAQVQQNLDQTKAIISLVLGIVSFIFSWVPILGLACGIIALVLGLQAKKAAEQQPNVYGGKGLALAGFILGIVGIVVGIIYSLWWIFVVLVFTTTPGLIYY